MATLASVYWRRILVRYQPFVPSRDLVNESISVLSRIKKYGWRANNNLEPRANRYRTILLLKPNICAIQIHL
jgi:hypothetical protein